jgi:thiosulfate reductase cytochrome b subunit
MPAVKTNTTLTGHKAWVKITHWIGTLSFLLLLFSGFEIIMVHPRFYWGNVGNDLTPALFELPVSRNYHHGGWTAGQPFFDDAHAPVSASRTYDIFNQNGWGRSLHFLSAWILVITGIIYLALAFYTRHVQRNLLPGKQEFSFKNLVRDTADHVRKKIAFVKGPQYGLLQKISYIMVLFILTPLMVLTGLTMSPAVAASCSFLLTMFDGAQSARTIHFFASVLLLIFLLIHVVMIIRGGFKKHMLAMTIEA